MTPRSLYPFADPSDPDTVASMRRWLAEAELGIAEYREHGSDAARWFGRGYLGREKAKAARIRKWFKLAGIDI